MSAASNVHINGISADTAARAGAAIRDDAERFLLAYEATAALVTDVRLDDTARQEAYAGLVDFVTDHLRRYLAATDRVLYATAAGAPETRLLVHALRRLRDALDRLVDEVVGATTPDQISHTAQTLGAVLVSCLDIERTVLLPALAELPGADLPRLADDLYTLLRGGNLDVPDMLDMRSIPHGQRHPRIFGRYARLAPGESFVLVNSTTSA